MAVVTFLTALSGLRYIVTNWQLFMPPYKPKEDKMTDDNEQKITVQRKKIDWISYKKGKIKKLI